MKSVKPKKVVNSTQLIDYKLPKALLEKLERAMQLRQYMLTGGGMPPNFIRIYHADLLAIDNKVREQSENKFNASTVYYKTLPIISEREQPQGFALAS